MSDDNSTSAKKEAELLQRRHELMQRIREGNIILAEREELDEIEANLKDGASHEMPIISHTISCSSMSAPYGRAPDRGRLRIDYGPPGGVSMTAVVVIRAGNDPDRLEIKSIHVKHAGGPSTPDEIKALVRSLGRDALASFELAQKIVQLELLTAELDRSPEKKKERYGAFHTRLQDGGVSFIEPPPHIEREPIDFEE